MSGVPIGGAGAEIQLLEAARRAVRPARSARTTALGAPGSVAGTGRIAFVLHLSLLRPPAPRPHHRRIARALLQDAAHRYDGQIFSLRNGDIVLLCQDTGLIDRGPGRSRPFADHPDTTVWARSAHGADGMHELVGAAPAVENLPHAGLPLAEAMARLLRIDAVDPARLVSVWLLESEREKLLAYAAARAEEHLADPPAEEEPATAPGFVDEIGALVAVDRIHDLMQRQTGVMLPGPGERGEFDHRLAGGAPARRVGRRDDAVGATAFRPIYREVAFNIAALEARLSAGGRTASDPFLFRHLAGQLDRRMLDVVTDQLGRGGPLDMSATARAAPPLHLNLTLGAILSASFETFSAACRAAGATAGIEISFIEVCADTGAFAAARAAVQRAGMQLVLDGMSHLTFLLAAPWMLQPDLLKLDWSPRLNELPSDEEAQMLGAIDAAGPQRLILQRAETEAAVRWGMARGIRRFQGRHVDAVLGAGRIMTCPLAHGCALRQCIERAGAVGPAGRTACGNPRLLDAGSAAGDSAPPEREPVNLEVIPSPPAAPHRAAVSLR